MIEKQCQCKVIIEAMQKQPNCTKDYSLFIIYLNGATAFFIVSDVAWKETALLWGGGMAV
jgi:hypothetical protein